MSNYKQIFKMTKKTTINLFLVILGLIIAFLGELMPDNLKSQIESTITNKFNISFQTFWIALVAMIFCLIIYFTINQEKETDLNSSNNINQYGKKSIYIKNNKGGINIK